MSVSAGLKVIDAAGYIAAPAAATILSDHGAELIRIEPPGEGDSFRGVHRIPNLAYSEHNCLWLQGARNRRSTVGVVPRLRASAVVG